MDSFCALFRFNEGYKSGMLVRFDYGVEVFTFARNSIGERQLQILRFRDERRSHRSRPSRLADAIYTHSRIASQQLGDSFFKTVSFYVFVTLVSSVYAQRHETFVSARGQQWLPSGEAKRVE